MACKSIIMIYRTSWSFVAPHGFFAKLRILHLVNFTDGTVFETFFFTLADIVLIFWHVSQLPAFLKAAYKDRHISYILKDDQIPSRTSERILYLQEYMQSVGDLVLPCNTFRMLVTFLHYKSFEKTEGKEEIAHKEQFFHFPFFCTFVELPAISIKFKIVICKFIQFWTQEPRICRLGKDGGV